MRPPMDMTDEEINTEMNTAEDDDRFAALEAEICNRRSDARLVRAYLEDATSTSLPLESGEK